MAIVWSISLDNLKPVVARNSAASHTVATHPDQIFGTSQLVLNSYSDLAHSGDRFGGGRSRRRRAFELHSINI
jgi:hypothetical protein